MACCSLCSLGSLRFNCSVYKKRKRKRKKKVSVPAIVEKGVSPGYCRIGDHFLKQFASLCGQPIRNRCAIQSIVITLSALTRAAIFTLTASVFPRPSKSYSLHLPYFNKPTHSRWAYSTSLRPSP